MMAPSLLVESYSRLTAACIAGLWQGGVLVLLAAALLAAMPRAQATLRHTLLVAVFFTAAVLPWVHFGAMPTQAAGGHGLRIAPWVAALIAVAWLAVGAVRATGLFLAWRRLRSIRQRAIPFAVEGINSYTAGARTASLCLSSEVDSPIIVGFRKPRLLLPDWMAPQLTADDLRQIALHECEHLRRYDDWLNLLLQVGRVLSPLNPALAWLDRRIGTQRELACDAAVIATTAQPIAYAQCLTRLAEQRIHHNRFVLALAALGRRSELGERVQTLLNQSSTWTKGQSRLAGAAIAAVMVAGAFGLMRMPLVVRIANAPTSLNTQSSSLMASQGTSGLASPGDSILRDERNNRALAPIGVRAVPTSFVVKPVTARAAWVGTRRRARVQHWAKAGQVQPQTMQPRVMRTRATVPMRARARTVDFQASEDESTIRFVTATFPSTYLALPVSDGWLIFQL